MRKLPGGDATDGIQRAIADEIDAKLRLPAAVNADEAHFEQDLRIALGDIDIEQIDDLAARGCDLDRPRRAVQILDCSAQIDDSRVRR